MGGIGYAGGRVGLGKTRRVSASGRLCDITLRIIIGDRLSVLETFGESRSAAWQRNCGSGDAELTRVNSGGNRTAFRESDCQEH